MNFMFVVPGQPQVIFVQTDDFLMFQQDVDVLLSEFVWDLQVVTSCDFVYGQLGPGSVWNIALDGCGDFCGCVICEGVELVVLDLH